MSKDFAISSAFIDFQWLKSIAGWTIDLKMLISRAHLSIACRGKAEPKNDTHNKKRRKRSVYQPKDGWHEETLDHDVGWRRPLTTFKWHEPRPRAAILLVKTKALRPPTTRTTNQQQTNKRTGKKGRVIGQGLSRSWLSWTFFFFLDKSTTKGSFRFLSPHWQAPQIRVWFPYSGQRWDQISPICFFVSKKANQQTKHGSSKRNRTINYRKRPLYRPLP